MEQFSVLERTADNNKSLLKEKVNPMLENILSEGGNDFFQYLNCIGLTKELNLMVLSSMHHYYYDHNDLKEIGILINLKKLNQVKHLESFLHTLFRILPAKAYFVGCFDNNHHNGNGVSFYNSSKFLKGFVNIFEVKAERSLSKKVVTKLLEEQNFKVIDITDINGTTYFWAQNNRKPTE